MRILFLSAAILVVSIAASAQTITLSPLPKADYCVGDTFVVSYTTTGTFASDNQFVVQLSTDSFKTWTIVGRDAKATGQILCVIVNVGAGYYLRVASTNPTVTSQSTAGPIVIHSPPSTDFEVSSKVLPTGSFNPMVDLIDDTIHFSGSSPGVLYSWQLNNDAIVTSRTNNAISFYYPTGGTKTGTVTVSDVFCSQRSRQFAFNIFDCNPLMNAKIRVVTGTDSNRRDSRLHDSVLVKSGGQFTDKNDNSVVFVETGGSLIVSGGVRNGYYFVKRGSSITWSDDVGNPLYLFLDSGVSVKLPYFPEERTILHCNDLEFGIKNDTAFAVSRTSWDAGSLAPGSSDSMTFQITNKSSSGVTFVGTVGSPIDPAFVVSSGGGVYSISEAASHSFTVVYHSDGKAHSSSMLVHGPRARDTVRIALSSKLHIDAGVTELEGAISIRQIASQLLVRYDRPFSLRLVNSVGVEVSRAVSEVSMDLDLSKVPAGVYFAVIEASGKHDVRKVIVTAR